MGASSILGLFASFIPGFVGAENAGDIQQLAKTIFGSQTGLVALSGGGQVGATQLILGLNEVDTVAVANNSVALPLALPGAIVWVNNNGANSMQVFGQPNNPANGGAGDTIAPNTSTVQAATGVGVAQASAKAAVYICTTLGQWKQFLSA